MEATLKLLITGMALVLITLSANAQDKKLAKSEEKFCMSLQEFGGALVQLDGINENSTVAELRSSYNEAQKSWNRLLKAAAKLEKVELLESQKAYDALVKSINEIEGDVKTSEATEVIDQNIDYTASKIAEIMNVMCD